MIVSNKLYLKIIKERMKSCNPIFKKKLKKKLAIQFEKPKAEIEKPLTQKLYASFYLRLFLSKFIFLFFNLENQVNIYYYYYY